MVLNKTQRNILFALGIMKGKKICLDDLPLLCRSIDRSDLTIRRNFGKLVKMGLLTKKKIKYSFYFLLTDEGSDEFNELMNEYDHLYFTPRKHNVPVSFKVVEVIGLVKDPFHKIFILNLFFQKKKFDLMRTIDSLGMIESENSLNIMIRKSKLFDDHAGPSNFAYCLLDSSLYTYDLEAIKNIKDWSEGTYEGYAMQGELMIQRGQYEDAYQLFSTLMKINNLPEDIRFVLDIGVIKSLHGLDRLDEMRSLIRTLKNTMKNKIALAFLKQIEADILSMKGEKEKAAVLFDSCIRTFRHYHYSVF
ncbi:MAG: hypothetical protein U9R75_05735, partial [Candidatus Thermoplasmatota archaeon]|nr:hypothetical protein [Candidatus Thermoplasmatota archaeon]